ncbi:MAG: methyltransferase [Chloroflexi bacterium]|nr:methyltransferase [Chloroflexota bacterium]
MIVLSHFQAKECLQAQQAGLDQVESSLDLNRSRQTLLLNEVGLQLPDGHHLSWDQLGLIASEENKCFRWDAGNLAEIRVFSEHTNWLRSLYPTPSAPTTLVSGTPMHRIKNTDPLRDTLAKIKAARPTGQVLDTATGLGYTAIEAAKLAEQVTTVELDPAALEICRLNPWSQDLFDNPKISLLVGDVFDVVEEADSSRFSTIIHDPPVFSLAGDLYSTDFYRELYRVLTHRGRLFHYIGDPDSKSGQGVTRGVIKRLGEAGFERIKRRPEAFGVLAFKTS